MEFIPADDEKGPSLRHEAQGEREAGQADANASQTTLRGALPAQAFDFEACFL